MYIVVENTYDYYEFTVVIKISKSKKKLEQYIKDKIKNGNFEDREIIDNTKYNKYAENDICHYLIDEIEEI